MWRISITFAVEIGVGIVFNKVVGDITNLFKGSSSTGIESGGWNDQDLVDAFLVSQLAGRALALAALFSPLKKRTPELFGICVSLLFTLAGLIAATVTESRDVVCSCCCSCGSWLGHVLDILPCCLLIPAKCQD
jgi:hypothetical protein